MCIKNSLTHIRRQGIFYTVRFGNSETMKTIKILKDNFILLFVGVLVIVFVAFIAARISYYVSLDDSIPAFPGAEGFGAMTQGGRFGRIVFVTNVYDTTDINDPNYIGSLRWAIEHVWDDNPDSMFDEGRIVVFQVGGTIDLVDRLIIKNPYTTIAGQTAPGGIMLKGDELTIATHDVIVRGIRVRVGDSGVPTCCRDGINIGTYYADGDVYNVIVDHSSISWAIDENISIWTDPADGYTIHDVSLQWNIIAEGLHDSIHIDEGASVVDAHSMGLIVGGGENNISIHHNLFAHNWGRNPRVEGADRVEIINNLIYGWGNAAVEFSDNPVQAHLVGNFFKTTEGSSLVEIVRYPSTILEDKIYIMGNIVDDPRVDINFFEARHPDFDESVLFDSEVFSGSNINLVDAQVAYADVLSNSGAITPARDLVDQRIINDVINRSGNIINSQNEVGGWPDFIGTEYPLDTDNDGMPDDWELAHGIDPLDSSDANNYYKRSPGGYTWIEEYVNSLIPLLPDDR